MPVTAVFRLLVLLSKRCGLNNKQICPGRCKIKRSVSYNKMINLAAAFLQAPLMQLTAHLPAACGPICQSLIPVPR